jgi:hypothetical protein
MEIKFRMWHLHLILGIVFAILTIMMIFLAVSLYVDDSRGADVDMSGDIVIFCCLPFFLPETIIFILLAIYTWKRARDQQELAARLDTYRIIKIGDLAQKMGKKEDKARKMVKACIKRKYVIGRLDEKEETFYTTVYLESTPNIINGWRCASCNAENQEIILPGEVGKCSSCDDVLDNRAKDVTTVNGEDLLPPDPKKAKEEEKKPIVPRKIEAPAAVKQMMEQSRPEVQPPIDEKGPGQVE